MTLIKIAVKLAKKNPHFKGVFEINEYNLDWALEKTSIEKLWGIGHSRGKHLRKLGINNAKQFRDYPYIGKIQELLTINGRKIQLELHGVQCFKIDEPIVRKKEISHARTLENKTNDLVFLREALATYVTLAAEDMRSERSLCKQVTVWLRSDPHSLEDPIYNDSKKIDLPGYTLDTTKLIRTVWHILDQMHDQRFEYKKIGISLKNLQDLECYQPSLLDDNDSPERISLMNTTDNINKIRPSLIRFAACGLGKGNFEAWRPMMTPSHCTNWKEIPVIEKVIGYNKGA